MNVVIEGVADNVLEKPARMVKGPDRKIGHDFACTGLPKASFAPILETLRSISEQDPGLRNNHKEALLAERVVGCDGKPGRFAWKGPSGAERSNCRPCEGYEDARRAELTGNSYDRNLPHVRGQPSKRVARRFREGSSTT